MTSKAQPLLESKQWLNFITVLQAEKQLQEKSQFVMQQPLLLQCLPLQMMRMNKFPFNDVNAEILPIEHKRNKARAKAKKLMR